MTSPTVTQADREAAAAYHYEWCDREIFNDGCHCGAVQAFSRHREQTVAEVVAYIRSIEREDGLPFCWDEELLSGEYQKHREKLT